MLRRPLLCLCLLAMSVAGLTVVGATPASAGLTRNRSGASQSALRAWISNAKG